MCEAMNKGTCFCRCLFLVEMRGIDSRRELRGLVGRGHDSPPDCRSVPLLLRSPSSLFANNKQKKEALAFLQVLLSVYHRPKVHFLRYHRLKVHQ